MKRLRAHIKTAIFTIALTAFCQSAFADDNSERTFIIKGSSTVHNYIFHTNVDGLHQDCSSDFKVMSTNSSKGLADLANGVADIAMISTDLLPLVENLNASEGLNIDINDYSTHKVAVAKVLLITHPKNPIKSLSKEQAKGLFTGTIKNWEDIGVENIGVVNIVTEPPTGGVYNTILQQVTDNQPITEKRLTMQTAPQTSIIVSQVTGSFSMLSDATPKEHRLEIKVVDTPDFNISQNLYFIAKKGTAGDKLALEIIKTFHKRNKL